MKRIFLEGWKQFWRNKQVTATTILLGSVILFLLNILFGVQFLVENMIQDFEERADFSVPLKEDYDPFLLESLSNELLIFPATSAEVFEEQIFESLEIPRRLYISFSSIEDVDPVLDTLKNTRYADLFDNWDGVLEEEFRSVVHRLLQIKQLLGQFSFGLILLFIGASVILVYNSFQMLGFMRRNEIGIARIVGANDAFILGPFVFEGVLIGFLSAILSFAVFVVFLKSLAFFNAGAIFAHLVDHYLFYEILVAILLGAFGAFLSVRRYLSGVFFKG